MARSSPSELLGLTLCYETDAEDGLTDIFVDDIHEEGVAARDGRLRVGDQIIQVGEDFLSPASSSHKINFQMSM